MMLSWLTFNGWRLVVSLDPKVYTRPHVGIIRAAGTSYFPLAPCYDRQPPITGLFRPIATRLLGLRNLKTDKQVTRGAPLA